MPVSSPTKCIACSLDTYRGALYPIFFTFSCVFVFISTLKDTWSAEKVQESTSNEKISLASNILCPFQAQQSALRAPSIPIEAPCIPSSSLFLASSSSYRPSKIHGPPRKFMNQPQTRKSASPRIYAPFQAQQSALRAPSIPIEAPCIPSSSLFLASSPSYHPPKMVVMCYCYLY
jgi:hypothetical protein